MFVFKYFLLIRRFANQKKIHILRISSLLLCLSLVDCGDGTSHFTTANNSSSAGGQSSTSAGGSSPNSSIVLNQLSQDVWADKVLSALTDTEKLNYINNFGISSDTSYGLVPTLRYSETEGGANWGGDGTSYRRFGTPVMPPLGVAASWDVGLAYMLGDRVGKDIVAYGGGVGAGIGMNIARDPRNGRNYEYWGEDPLLAGKMAAQHILGFQNNPVYESAKHYVDNEQETNRGGTNAIVDERSQHEIHLLPFEIAVKEGNPGAVMCSFNFVNGVQSCANSYLQTDVLKNEWGFQGYVVTDCCNLQLSGTQGYAAGTDLMWLVGRDPKTPGLTELNDGELSPSRLNDARRRMLRSIGRIESHYPIFPTTPDWQNGRSESQNISEQSQVLLKNIGVSTPILPLDTSTSQKIALIGANADHAVYWGGGSSWMQDPTTSTGTYTNDNWFNSSPKDSIQTLAPHAILSYDGGNSPANAASVAREADVAIVFVYQYAGESTDVSLNLPSNQDALITAVAATGKPTIVVAENGVPFLMPWLNDVDAVLEAWYPGIQGGQAIADLLFGVTNPSGKLPISFPASTAQLINPTIVASGDVPFNEGLNVGYRWYDSQNITPLFPFGFGLSYTTFGYSNLATKVDPNGSVLLNFTLSNTGNREGKEVVQVYAALPPEANEPPQRLVAWQKVDLAAGASAPVSISVDPDNLRIWDSTTHRWTFLTGNYTFYVSASSRDHRLTQAITIANQPPPKPVTVSNVTLPLTVYAGVKQTYEVYGTGLDGAHVTATLGGVACSERSQRYDRIFRAWCQAPAQAGSAELSIFDADKEIARESVDIQGTPSTPGGYLRVDEHGEPFGGYDLAQYTGAAATLDVCVLQTRDQDGKPLAQNLLWEVKRNDGGLRDLKNLYTNLSEDQSDGNTLGYIGSVNRQEDGLGLCGSNLWRLPTMTELQGIVTKSANASSVFIDPAFFPNSYKWGYWTSTPGTDSAHNTNVAFDSANNTFQSPNAEKQTAIRLVGTQ